jgi:hypothetical protein
MTIGDCRLRMLVAPGNVITPLDIAAFAHGF